jgi:two-component system sensor histidine kinase/response regulator
MTKNPPSAKLLIVDDNELNRQLVKLTLGKLGYGVEEAGDGSQALDRIESGGIDLVLLDISMPGMDGFELLRRLRERVSMLELPVIMFTADDNQERIVEALTLGANDYLTKPLNPAVAAARIRTQLSISTLCRLKDNFVSFASHDLKKPMLVIADIVETLRGMQSQNADGAGEMYEYLDLLEKTNQHMRNVVNGFLDQTGYQADESKFDEQVDMNNLINEIQQSNAVYASKKNSRLNTELARDLPTIRADGFKIRQVLDNIVGNAIKFSPTGASVLIRSKLQAGEILIEVIDDGPGLTDADQEKLFKRGAALSNKPTGGESSSGIGLSLCKELIESSGGKIGARSNAGKGATFWFSLRV